MLYDIVAANRQAVQSGTALGAQMFNNSLRMQQLQSQEAMRRLQEQQLAQASQRPLAEQARPARAANHGS